MEMATLQVYLPSFCISSKPIPMESAHHENPWNKMSVSSDTQFNLT